MLELDKTARERYLTHTLIGWLGFCPDTMLARLHGWCQHDSLGRVKEFDSSCVDPRYSFTQTPQWIISKILVCKRYRGHCWLQRVSKYLGEAGQVEICFLWENNNKTKSKQITLDGFSDDTARVNHWQYNKQTLAICGWSFSLLMICGTNAWRKFSKQRL